MPIYEKFELKCGHLGHILWRSNDGKVISVRGTKKRCRFCSKPNKSGWGFTVHNIDISGEPQKRPSSPEGVYRLET